MVIVPIPHDLVHSATEHTSGRVTLYLADVTGEHGRRWAKYRVEVEARWRETTRLCRLGVPLELEPLMITALAERAMSLWPNKGDADGRPPLGSGYDRIAPVFPHRPAVPAGATGALRLDAKQSDIIPEYPY
jgi:hypothetical protein